MNLVEESQGDSGLMDARVPLALVPDPTGVELVVEDPSYRCSSEKSGSCGQGTVRPNQGLGVPGPVSQVVDPGGQLAEGGRTRGI